jgi:hypothetical protein
MAGVHIAGVGWCPVDHINGLLSRRIVIYVTSLIGFASLVTFSESEPCDGVAVVIPLILLR